MISRFALLAFLMTGLAMSSWADDSPSTNSTSTDSTKTDSTETDSTQAGAAALAQAPADVDVIELLVMDPLSKPLSCDCVKGYAQRDYELLGAYLKEAVGKDVRVHWFESMVEAKQEIGRVPDLVIGKDSVVRADGKTLKQRFRPVAALTGKDGKTTQTGLIVVRAADSAKSVTDLAGYKVLFGPTDAAEKSSAVIRHLSESKVEIDKSRKRFNACSEAAVALLEMPAQTKAAAVISSYAKPLLEGCGSVQRGDLRVVSETKPVPFISAMARAELDTKLVRQLRKALLKTGEEPTLLTGLETQSGFVAYPRKKPAGGAEKRGKQGRKAKGGEMKGSARKSDSATKKK